MNKWDLVIIVALIVIVFVGGYLIYWLNINAINSCTSNPLVYAAQKYERDYDRKFIGTGIFVPEEGEALVSSTVFFNSENVTFQNTKY